MFAAGYIVEFISEKTVCAIQVNNNMQQYREEGQTSYNNLFRASKSYSVHGLKVKPQILKEHILRRLKPINLTTDFIKTH